MERIKTIFKTIRPLRSIHFLLMTFLGAFISYNFNLINLILAMISIFFAWQFNLIINDIFDVEIDKVANTDRIFTQRLVSRKKYLIVGISCILISVLTGLFLNFLTLNFLSVIFICFFILMGYLYSGPPFRLRKYSFQTFFIGLGSFSAYMTGFFACSTYILYREFIIGILILIALSLGTVVKDYKDIEGDKKDKVATIFTKFGLETGTKICSIFLFLTFLIPLLLIYHLFDFIIIIPIAITTVVMFNWKKNKKKVEVTFIFYFFEIAYIFLRYFSILIF
ncbi:MAG: hypothetical protein EAX96_07280 [Candidatus Lokiarchaeota archaeon]|nr:hypothetical protein [Candidatus Lokiarchaeota archaeon]